MNTFDEMEMALIQASQMQREALADMGLTFSEVYPEESDALAQFIAAYEAPRNFEA
jgi:hypothetical protein